MNLYQLLFGKSKKKMNVLMIDTKERCEALKKAREATKGSKAAAGWHKIELAPADSKPKAHKSCSVKGSGNKHNTGPAVIGKNGNPRWSGYVSKRGFQVNT